MMQYMIYENEIKSLYEKKHENIENKKIGASEKFNMHMDNSLNFLKGSYHIVKIDKTR